MSRLIDADALKEDIEMQVKMLESFGIEDLRLIGEEMKKGMIAEIDKQPTVAASPWRRVEEEPRDGQECVVAYLGPTDWIYEHATYHSDLNKALEEDIFIEGTDGFIVDSDVGYARHGLFKYWMPIEPPKE